MRNALLAVVLTMCAGMVRAGESGRVFFPDLLPGNTMACIVPPDGARVERDYSQTIFARLANLPEMGPFLKSFEESRQALANDIVQAADIPPQLADELVNSRLGFALIDVGLGRDGKPVPEFAVAITLQSAPDRNTVFSAVMALLNRPDVVRSVLESQGIDPNTPLRSLAQEETVPGGPPILRIGPNIRVASIGNMVLLYHGPGADGIRKVFEAARNPATALTGNPSFQASYRGAGAQPGSSLCYFNIPRVMAVFDALNMSRVSRVADALGFGSVQSMAVSGAYHQDGVRHTMFLHTPGGAATGLMSALIPLPEDSPLGMEGYSQVIPSAAEAFLSMRVDIPVLMRELPYLLDTLGAATRPGGISRIVANERILDVPLADIVQTLGGDVVIRPHDDTQVLMFQDVDVAAFENVIARMEQNSGIRFSSQNIGGYIVHYFNRRATLAAPLAPAFCLVPRAPGSPTGILYMASHPQAVVSLIRESTSARDPLSGTPDFLKASSGTGNNYSLFYYNAGRDCYRRVYNFLLPVLSLWSSSTSYPVDAGLLPTAQSILPEMFGSALGFKSLPDGIQAQIFSPVGSGALFVQLADKLVVSNPLVIGYIYSMLETWMAELPAW
ncbi:MAG: hypothetical protein LBS30_05585 [Planctomycetota bacterium]|jgi:hypothetical protein|nr:hypothetical protein [Planctomycetota bacterium]